MIRLLISIMIGITILTSSFIVYKMITSNSGKAHIVTAEGKKKLSEMELNEIEKALVNEIPGRHPLKENRNTLSGSGSAHQNTLNQIEQINKLNRQQK